jgi:aspartyl-tRNA(Asn)/glutamyl-tRNA(Gln) amidotransferase subunit A
MSIINYLSDKLSSGSLTYEDIWKHYINNIKTYNSTLNAVVQNVQFEHIKHNPNTNSVLNGIPIIYKDNICTTQLRTTCASRMLEYYVSPFDATVVLRLQEAGAVMIGKANMDEFAMGDTTDPELYGPTKNPWNISLGTGGSSGGSAASVSARFAPIALGSDTGGSIRLPAHLCGVIGMKPTYGLVSRYGLISYASSLDHIGVAGLSAIDIAHVLDTIGGKDIHDNTSLFVPDKFFSRKLDQSPKATIGVDYSWFTSSNSIGHHFVLNLQHAGYTVKPLTLPPSNPALQCYYIIACTEASSNLARFDGIRYGGNPLDTSNLDLDALYRTQRSKCFGQQVKSRIMAGNFFVSPDNYDDYYGNAIRYRRHLYDTYEEIYDTHDLDCILMPVCSGELAETDKKHLGDLYNVIANLLGYPAIAFPVTMSNARPLGLQLMGRRMKDDVLLHIVNKMQEYNDVLKRCPPFGGQDLK